MTYTKEQITKRKFDVVIIGAGGSGMRASLQLARAGLRHLWMDATHEVGLAFGRNSALVVIVLSTVVAFALGFKLFF